MINDIIKIPDDESMHYHLYCPKCNFLFIQLRGAKYCPNCGIELNWNSPKLEKNFEDFVDISKKHYIYYKGLKKND